MMFQMCLKGFTRIDVLKVASRYITTVFQWCFKVGLCLLQECFFKCFNFFKGVSRKFIRVFVSVSKAF